MIQSAVYGKLLGLDRPVDFFRTHGATEGAKGMLMSMAMCQCSEAKQFNEPRFKRQYG